MQQVLTCNGPATSTPTNDTPIRIKEKTIIPPINNNSYLDQLIALNLTRSVAHQQKFLARKDNLTKAFPRHLLFHSPFDRYAGLPLSDEFAFLHIYKCGGSTIQDMFPDDQRNQHQLHSPVMTKRKWVAFVRDPIDRFLSGWAECGSKSYINSTNFPFTTLHWHTVPDYDFRVRAWLYETKSKCCSQHCSTHSHPQANYLINKETGKIDAHFHVIGDLSNLKDVVVKIANFSLWKEGVIGRDASSNAFKQQYFPNRRDWLSDATILELCEYLKLDYYLFDFTPPRICIQQGGPLYDIY